MLAIPREPRPRWLTRAADRGGAKDHECPFALSVLISRCRDIRNGPASRRWFSQRKLNAIMDGYRAPGTPAGLGYYGRAAGSRACYGSSQIVFRQAAQCHRRDRSHGIRMHGKIFRNLILHAEERAISRRRLRRRARAESMIEPPLDRRRRMDFIGWLGLHVWTLTRCYMRA